MERELLHAAERRRHGHHEQAAIARGERAIAGPDAPRHGRQVVLELGGDRVRVGGHPVDVGVAEHRAAHRTCGSQVLRLFHVAASQTAGSTTTSKRAAPLSGTCGCRQTSAGNDTFTSE